MADTPTRHRREVAPVIGAFFETEARRAANLDFDRVGFTVELQDVLKFTHYINNMKCNPQLRGICVVSVRNGLESMVRTLTDVTGSLELSIDENPRLLDFVRANRLEAFRTVEPDGRRRFSIPTSHITGVIGRTNHIEAGEPHVDPVLHVRVRTPDDAPIEVYDALAPEGQLGEMSPGQWHALPLQQVGMSFGSRHLRLVAESGH